MEQESETQASAVNAEVLHKQLMYSLWIVLDAASHMFLPNALKKNTLGVSQWKSLSLGNATLWNSSRAGWLLWCEIFQ